MPNPFQRLFAAVLPRPKPMQEMGVSGIAVQGGRITSPERNSKWTGYNRYVTSSEIAVNVSIVAASVHYFLNLIAHPNWSVKASDENNAESVKLAEFVESMMTDMEVPWSRVVRRAGMYRFHGFGVQEWVAKKRADGQIGFRTIEPRPQHTIEQWDIAEDGRVNGMWQRSPQTGELIGLPRSKVVYLVEDTLTDSPEGLGMFRHLGEPYERLKTYLALETISFERDLRGIPIGRAPLTAINNLVKTQQLTQVQADTIINGMKAFIENEVKQPNTGLMLDSQPYQSQAADGLKIAGSPQWDLSLLQGSASGLSELAQAIDRLQREMARILGTEHLMMGDAGGNRALAVDKSRNLYLIANAVLANISNTFEQDLLTPLWLLNGFPDELKPTLQTEDVAFKDVGEVTAALRDMATAGAVLDPTDEAINDVRDLLGISHAPDPTPEVLGGAGRDSEGNPLTQEELHQQALDRQAATIENAAAAGGGTNDNQPPPAAAAKARRLARSRFVENGKGLIVVPAEEEDD